MLVWWKCLKNTKSQKSSSQHEVTDSPGS